MDQKKKILAWIQLVSYSLILLCLGFLSGMAYEEWSRIQQRSPLVVGDFSDEISLLRLEKIENGRLKGSLEGEEMRIVLQDENIISLFPGEVDIPIERILPLLKRIPAPEGMSFVASSRGKYIWALDTPQAALIPVKNRVFFSDEAEANAAGYERKK